MSRKCQLYLFQIGHCAAAVSAGAQRGIHVLFNQGQIIACSQLVLQEERRADTAELPMRNDSNPVTQNVCLIHVVCGEDDSAAWKKAREDTAAKSTRPMLPSQSYDRLDLAMKLDGRLMPQIQPPLKEASSTEKVHNCCHGFIVPALRRPLSRLPKAG